MRTSLDVFKAQAWVEVVGLLIGDSERVQHHYTVLNGCVGTYQAQNVNSE